MSLAVGLRPLRGLSNGLVLNGQAPNAALSYNATVLADSPVGFWPLNESTGTTAFDLSGNANNGTYSGAFALGATGIGDAQTSVNFTGGKMTVADAAPLRLGAGNISVEAWVNASSLPSFAVLWDNGTSSTTRSYAAFLNAGGAANSIDVAFGGQAGTSVTGSSSLVVSTLYHVVVTSTGAAIVVYINGASWFSGAQAAGVTNGSTGVTFFGNPSTGAGLLQGLGSKLAVYNTVLTGTRVLAHFNARNNP